MRNFISNIPLLALVFSTGAPAQGLLPANQFATLTREHADVLCVLYHETTSPPLSLITWQREAGLDLPTNQVILVVKEDARLTLPSGTPFGDAGAPFWILPQTQNPNLLYAGVNVGRIPTGIFDEAIRINLVRFDGPGYFMVWQATGPGQFNIRIDSRDGVGVNDFFQPLPGAHEHFNWGFSAPGIYSLTLQVVGRRSGEVSDIMSAESTFLFQIQPLPPPTRFSTWQKHFWPPGFNAPTTLPHGNPDEDPFDNLHEYAFGLSPTNINLQTEAPRFDFVTSESLRFGALSYRRYLPAQDLSYNVQGTSELPGIWQSLTKVDSQTTNPTNTLLQRIAVRDYLSTSDTGARFYRVNLELFEP